MALLRHLKVVLLILTLCIEHHHGAMFKLHMVKIYQNALDAEAHCKQLRFDGLAVLSSPEAYRNAIRMTKPYREVANFYIGLHFIPDTGDDRWDDGTVATPDTPIRYPGGNLTYRGHTRGRILKSGKAFYGPGKMLHYSLCGNYNNQPSEAQGTNSYGQQPKGVRSSLSITSVSTYLECTMLCALDYRCKVAHFASNEKTCSILAKGTYSVLKANPKSHTFLRNRSFLI